MSQRNQKSICPFCGAKGLSPERMIPYFEDNSERNPIFHRNRIGIATLEEIIKNHNRNDGGYRRHWDANEPGGSGVLIRWEDVKKYGNRTKDNMYTCGEYTFTYDSELPGHILVRLNYVRTVKPVALLCPECESFFPLNYFEVDCKYIILAGRTSVGKSVYACSLFRDNFAELKGAVDLNQKYTLDVSFADTIDLDSRTKAFHNAVKAYNSCEGEDGNTYCLLPPETAGTIPPIFLKMTWCKPGKKDKYTFNLCLIDTEGESWVRTNTVEYTKLADAVLYLVEPAQGEDYRPYNPPEPQHLAAPARRGPDATIPDEEEKTEEQDERQAPDDYSTIYNEHFDDKDKWNDVIGAFVVTKADKYLRQPYQSMVCKDSIPFFDFLISEQNTQNASAKRQILLDFERTGLHNIAAFHLFQKHFSRLPVADPSFSPSGCFAVSAFTGLSKPIDVDNKGIIHFIKNDQKKNKALRSCITMKQRRGAFNIHEPFMWIMSQMFPDGFPVSSDHTEGAGSDETNASPFDTEARGRDRSRPSDSDRRAYRRTSSSPPKNSFEPVFSSDSERTYESVEPEDVFYTAKPAEPAAKAASDPPPARPEPIARSVRRTAKPTSNAPAEPEKTVSPNKDDKADDLYSRFFETALIDESDSVSPSKSTTDASDTDGPVTVLDDASQASMTDQNH